MKEDIMFKKILFPTDFSDVATKALEFVKRLKDSGAEEVIILNVIEEKYFSLLAEYSALDLVRFENDLKDDVTKKSKVVANILSDKGFKVKVKIVRGAPVTEILRIEQEEAVSIIVLGSHGMSNVREMLLGSVSEGVIRKSLQPVLVVKRESQA
jgi:nucleotide-binding universal stress UspA family protein